MEYWIYCCKFRILIFRSKNHYWNYLPNEANFNRSNTENQLVIGLGMRPKDHSPCGMHFRMINDVLDACRAGRIAELVGLLREDTLLITDCQEALEVDFQLMVGLGQCTKFLKGIFNGREQRPAYLTLHGRPAVLFRQPKQGPPTVLLLFEDDGSKLSKIYCIRHPARIRRYLSAGDDPAVSYFSEKTVPGSPRPSFDDINRP